MPGFSDVMRDIGHGVTNVLERALDHSSDDEDVCRVPNINDHDRFEAVRQRQVDFLDEWDNRAIHQVTGVDGAIQRSASLTPTRPNSEEQRRSSDEPRSFAIPITGIDTPESDVGNDCAATEPGPSNAARSANEAARAFNTQEQRRSADSGSRESEKANVFGPLLSQRAPRDSLEGEVKRSAFANLSRQPTSRGNSDNGLSGRPSLDSQTRGHSIEMGYPPARALTRSAAITMGPRIETSSATAGTIDEIVAGGQGRIVRRRVVLPYQITLVFGVASVVAAGLALGALIVGVRNAAWLHGPKAGPQLPEIKTLLLQLVNATQNSSAHAPGRK